MTRYRSCASPQFWELYRSLPTGIRRLADKQFDRFDIDPAYPALHLKPVGGFWSVRISKAYRALALREGDTFYWFWIGNHDEYERLVR